MSQGQDDSFFNFLVGALAVVLVLVGVFYTFSFLMPYVVFYVLPFLAFSVVVGFVLWFGVQNGEGKFQKVSEYSDAKRYVASFDFKMLAFVLPFLMLFTFLVFNAGSDRREVVDKQGNVTGTYLEWPKANHAFNEMKSNWYKDSMFESLRAKARETTIFDRSDIGTIFWMALIFGGPGLFFLLTLTSTEDESLAMSKVINEKVSIRESELRSLVSEQERIVKQRMKPLEDQISKLERRVSEVLSENQVLKAKMEFGEPATTVKKATVNKAQRKGSGGVLDGDLL